MFTFSFSAAFALPAGVSATDAAAKLAEAKTIAEKVIDNYYDVAMKEVLKSNVHYTLADEAKIAAAWSKINVKATLADEIATAYAAEAKNNNFSEYDVANDAATYAAKVFGISTKDDKGNAFTVDSVGNNLANKIIGSMGKEAAFNMYDADRAEIISAFDKIDYSVYSDKKTNADGKTYLVEAQEKAAKYKEEAQEMYPYTLENFKNFTDANVENVAWEIGQIKAYVEGKLEAQKYAGTSYETGLYLVKGVPTADKVEANELADAASVAETKAAIQKLYADYMKTESPDKEFAADYVKIYTYLAEQGVVKAADLATQGDIGKYVAGYKAVMAKAISDVEDLEAFAAKYAAEKDATGAYVRDAEEVNKVVAKAKLGTYAAAVGVAVDPTKVLTVTQAEDKIAAMSINSEAAELAFAKEVAKKALADAKADNIDDFYALEAEKIEAAYAKTLAKIEEAKTVDAVKKIDTAFKTMKGSVLNAKEVDNKVNFGAGAPAAALEAVCAYVAYANTGKNVLNAEYILSGDKDIKAEICKIYGEAGARTAAEMKAVTIDPAAVAAKLTTVGAVAAAKAAAEEAVKALPVKATEADKDAVVAAFDAVKAYKELGGALTADLQTKLNKAITDLKTDMVKNFAIEVAKADKTDLAAMKDLQAKFDAANKMFGKDKVFGETTKFDDSKVKDALKAIKAAQHKAVVKAINAIPVNVTEADKAVVKAARDAYDAYVKEWTKYDGFDNCFAAGEFDDYYKTLALAEATLGLNEDPAKAVESLKIKASSKATKGAITVKWTVKGDKAVADGFQVWKSTKAQKGYKKAITTKKTSFKNTKNLKKGTRYFYKVRAYKVVDGKTYYSDWSNKANRYAK